MNILIIGASGGLSQILIKIIRSFHPDYHILGIDNRSTDQLFKDDKIQYIQMKYSRGNFENLFRQHQFETVFHLARQTHTSNASHILSERMDFAMLGTTRILELCEIKKIKNLIFLSTFHVYGAFSDNPVFLSESSPLRASLKFPDLRDVVEMDQLCTSWMWKNQDQIKTVLLRPCNIIGTQINNSMTRYFEGPLSIKPIDFNTHFQFLHEFDMANILYRSIHDIPIGIYNIAGDDFISLDEAIEVTQTKYIPFPLSMASVFNKLLGKLNLEIPPYLIDYLKYSCLISNEQITKVLGKNFLRFSAKEALEAIRLK